MRGDNDNDNDDGSDNGMTEFLDEIATQASFGELVNITQSAVHKHVGKCLQKGDTHRVWLHAYCNQLRNEAAGRGGDNQASLTRARIQEAEAKAALTTVAYHEKIGTLIQASEAEKALVEWAGFAINEYQNCFESFVYEVESRYKIKIGEEIPREIIGNTFSRISAYAEKLGKSLVQESKKNND